MASNPYVNKVIYGSDTLIDLSEDTVTGAAMRSGYKAHDKSGAPITGTMSTVTPRFSGGTLNGSSATATLTNITTSQTDVSGVKLQANATATRATMLYSVSAGYIASRTNATAMSSNTKSWSGTTYYLSGVTLETPESGTREFSITVPNGDEGNITFRFVTDAGGNTTIMTD